MIYVNLVSFVLGILAEKFLGLGIYPALLFLTLSLSLTLVLKKEKRPTKTLIAFLFFSLGILRMAISSGPTLDELKNFSGKEISFESTILNEPDIRESSARYIVSFDSFTIEDFGSKVLLVADRFPEFNYGDKISISGTLETPENFVNENGIEFDYVSYLSKDDILLFMYRPDISKIGEGDKNFLVSTLYQIKKSFIKNIERVVPEPNSSLLAGILVGSKNSLGKNLLDNFKDVGLIHIVVLSGYNITLVIYTALKLTSKIESRKARFSFAVFGLIVFALMVGLSSTVLRASLMGVIAILAKYYGRESDALRALFLAGFLMLLWNPEMFTSDPSFQLSFMATLGLILFSPIVESEISEHKILSKILPPKLNLREIASSTIAVQFFILPILVNMSGSFSLISFLINIIVLPTIPTLMFFGFLTGLIGFVPLVGELLSWIPGSISYIISQYVITLAEVGSSLPLATIKTGGLPVFIVLLWYTGAAFVYRRFRKE